MEHVNDSANAEPTQACDKQLDNREEMPPLDESQSRSNLQEKEQTSDEVETVTSEEVPLEDNAPSPLSPPPGETLNETYKRQRRERRAPKVFTYNELGNPVCYNTELPAGSRYWHPSVPYGFKWAEIPWMNSVQYLNRQPVFLHGY